MKVEPSRLVNGIINYADGEVISSLPTSGKWLVGAGIGILTARINNFVDALNNNAMARALGIVDEDGMIDIDLLTDNLKASAGKYGRMTVQVPLIGRLTFSEADVDALRSYIERVV